MTDEAPKGTPTRKPWFAPRTLVGIVHPGARTSDAIIRKVLSAGFAGAAFLLVLHEWRSDRIEERRDRRAQHEEMVRVMREQHEADVEERRRDRCVSAQLNDTVRAAIWKERPRPRQDCDRP